MATMAREAWTDERLDDLNRRVDEGFREMKEEFRALRAEIAADRAQVNNQFAAQQRMMVQLFGGMFAMTTIGFLGVIATILTQT